MGRMSTGLGVEMQLECECGHDSSVTNEIVFFFFKQKTAYEMRISDWSSDVCSSDLISAFRLRKAEIRRGHKSNDRISDMLEELHRTLFAEIGRASGRERVCQYV